MHEKIVHIDKIIEKPVFHETIKEIEKIVEKPVEVITHFYCTLKISIDYSVVRTDWFARP